MAIGLTGVNYVELAERQIEQLRERLLDLSNRNRLINFRHPERSRTQVRVVDEVPATLYAGLLSAKAYRFNAILDPKAGTPGPRLPIDQVARTQGIEPSYELGTRRDGPQPPQHTDSVIQLLHYEADAERRLESMRQEHLTSLQELGVPALHVVFGFLEWVDRAEGTPLLSPLVLVPVDLERARERGQYRHKLTFAAEEPEPNRTLAFRLRRDTGIELPALDALIENEDLDAYLTAVENVIAGMPGWRVRRMVTISVLSFARQVMFEDLAATRWRSRGGRASSPLVRTLLTGTESTPESPPKAAGEREPLLITDADATQLAAIEEALAGRNLVVRGPPGTGKSQTITNLIAAALARGKKVLFVAEKMAALDVVKKRLDDAGLAPFCLALHSTKAKKREVIEAIARARDARRNVEPAPGIDDREHELKQLRAELDAYQQAMSSPIGSLGLSIRDVVWREQALRGELDHVAPSVLQLAIPGALRITRAALEESKRRLNGLEAALTALDAPPIQHRWRFLGGWDPLKHRTETVRAAVARWHDALGAVVAAFEGLPWGAEQLAPDAIAELASQLADLGHVDAKAPADLVRRLALPGAREAVERLVSDVQARTMQARRVKSIGPVAELLPRRGLLADVSRALAPLGLTQSGQAVGRLAQLVAAEHARSTAVVDAVEQIRAFAVERGLPGGWDLDMQRVVFRALELAREGGTEVLTVRTPGVLAENGRVIIERAASAAAALRETGEALDRTLTGWRELDPAELRRLATVLRATGLLGRVFGGAYRQARATYLQMSTGRAAPRDEMADRLQQAAEQLVAESNWCSDPVHLDLCGQQFRGLATDFDLIRRAHEWARTVSEVFSAGDARARWARSLLFESDSQRLCTMCEVAAAVGEPVASWLVVGRDVTEAAYDWLAAVNHLASLMPQLAGVPLDPRTPIADVVEVTGALERIAELDARIDAAHQARALLGPYWAGTETELGPILAALATCRSVQEIELPTSVASWVLEDTSSRLAHGRMIASRLAVALRDEEIAREHAREAGVTVGDVASPEAGVAGAIATLGAALATSVESLASWVQYLAARALCMDSEPLSAFCRALEDTPGRWASLPATYEWCLLRTLGAEAMRAHVGIARGTWTGSRLDQARARVVQLERELAELRRRQLAAQLAGVPVPRGRGTGPRGEWTNDALLANEIAKKTRHIPIRQLMSRAKDAMLALAPCLMMSPLSVAQYLHDPDLQFDLLVIDEASQLRPEDALGALLRAKQAVIVGDEQQLPPTEFFRRVTDDPSDGVDIEDEDVKTESVLELAMRVFGQPRVLLWHYRSRHESLITFSNEQFYEGQLVIAPAPRRPGPRVGVSLRHIKAVYEASTNVREADAVVDIVLDLMRERPEHSIGVVALNQQQADLIREKLDERLREGDGGYVERWASTLEPFFVKNLENVQGDERDVIVVSLTYGPDHAGRVYQRFGPISGLNGHRRLNVLFSRAKHQMIIASSMRADDIKVGPASHRGVQVLRDYLEFAARQGVIPAGRSAFDDSPFVRLARDIHQLGFEVDADVGTRNLRLDLGVRYPDTPAEFLAGIEVDAGGAGVPMAGRDRDCTRPLVLQNLGWTAASTWTADWLREPAVARKQIVSLLERAVRAAGRGMPPARARVSPQPLDEIPALATDSHRVEVPRLTLELRVGARIISRHEASGERVRLGRSRRCDVIVPDECEEVSGVHAELVWEQDRFVLADAGSRNGVYIDGRKVERVSLSSGRPYDIRLGRGSVLLRVVYGGALPRTVPEITSQGPPAPAAASTVDGTWPEGLAERLAPDERQLLLLVHENGTVRTSELAQRLGKAPLRVNGMARQLKRKLLDMGVVLFRDELLSDGETLYRRDEGSR